MKGLWDVPTTTIDPGLATTIFDLIVAVLVATFTGITIMRCSKDWPEARMLLRGMLLLCIWFILHWVDMMVHHFQASVKYNYIIVEPIFGTFKSFSDVFVLWGVWKVLIRYEELRPKKDDRKRLSLSTALGVSLLTLAFYQYCLLFALSFVWLSFADLGVINAIAEGRNGFDVAFTALQFCSSILTVAWAFLQVQMPRPKCPEGGSENWSVGAYKEQQMAMAAASVFLLLRAFCEVIIVGQLARWPASIEIVFRARDVTYGFFSMLFCFFIMMGAIPGKSLSADPLFMRHQVAVEEVSEWISTYLEQVTEGGQKTAPSVLTFLDNLENTLLAGTQNSVEDPRVLNEVKIEEVKRLKALYGDWEPVYKWQGETSVPVEEGVEIDTRSQHESDIARGFRNLRTHL